MPPTVSSLRRQGPSTRCPIERARSTGSRLCGRRSASKTRVAALAGTTPRRRFSTSKYGGQGRAGSRDDIEQRLEHFLVGSHHRGVQRERIAGGDLLDELVRQVDIRRGHHSVLVGVSGGGV